MMKELALFAGAGGGLLATHHLLDWRCVGYVEMAEYPCKILEARINDGLLSKAPIFQMHTRDFIRLELAEKYQGVADVVTAGFPCQPFSGAGLMLGELDERNGWPDTITIVRLVRPRFILLENVAKLTANPYFGTILGDLASSGYDVRWDCIPASAVGANHQRDRVWIAAYDTSQRDGCIPIRPGGSRQKTLDVNGIRPDVANAKEFSAGRLSERTPTKITGFVRSSENVANTTSQGRRSSRSTSQAIPGQIEPGRRSSSLPNPNGAGSQRQGIQTSTTYPDWWETEPRLGRMANGVANQLDRLKALGNGQVPAVVAEVWRLLME